MSANGYHHGDLRRALLDAASGLLDEGGVDAVTLRACARRAGVSHAAPYHHFADKAALVEALAADGQAALAERMRAACEAEPIAMEGLRGTGLAYLAFAVEQPALFRLMNRPEARGDAGDGGPVAAAAREGLAVLEGAIRAAQQAGEAADGDVAAMALTAWSCMHGLAVLLLDGLVEGSAPTPEEGARLADAVTWVLGLGLLTRAGGC